MANLGKCLLFYLKYPAEMERLYAAEDELKVEGLTNADRVIEKIKLVGGAAEAEGAALLQSCAQRIEDHFRTISAVQRVRNNIEKTWELKFTFGLKNANDRPLYIGVNILTTPTAVVPWIWCPGGRRAEDDIMRILGRGIRAAAHFESGTVWLTKIDIPIPERLDEPVTSDPLVASVQQAFASITEQDVEKLAGVGANRGDR